MSEGGESVPADEWRERVLRRTVWIVLVGSTLVWFAWVHYRGTARELPTLITLAAIVWLGVAALSRARPERLALALIASLTAAGSFSLVLGMVAGPQMCALAAVVSAGAFLGRRAVLFTLALQVSLLVGGGYAIERGLLPPPLPFDPSFAHWLRGSLVFTVVSATVAAIVGGVVRSLRRSLAHAQRTLKALEAEQARRVAADEKRRQAERALSEAAKLEAIGRLAGGTAHDFNNHLTVIQGWLDLLRRKPLAPAIRDGLDAIESARVQATQLSSQLLALGRQSPREPRPIAVSARVAELAENWRRVLPGNVELMVDAQAAANIMADEGELQRALLNLVLNARDALPKSGGKISIFTRDVELTSPRDDPALGAGKYVTVTVEDTGVGLDEAARPRIFEPFFTTKSEQGTGLGLAMVWSVMQSVGGAVEVQSALGHGCSFTLHFPSLEAREDSQLLRANRAASS